jgi:ATP-dependent DNA helicase RecQ
MTPKEILHQYWGYAAFRPLQEEIISAVLTGKDTLAILPTGGGKSICFQVPALAMDGLCLVISPLIALMQDQINQLDKKEIPAAGIYAGMPFATVKSTLQKAAAGEYTFLYVSPERLETRLFGEYLPYLPIKLIAVDEAHCISQWGYDFRPAYLTIADIRKQLPQVPLLALTASATAAVRQDIIDKLRLKDPSLFRQSFERPNLSYSIFEVESRAARLVEILQKVSGTAIVYCKTRKKTRDFADLLAAHKINAACYHAGLKQDERKERQEKWIRNEIRVMVCTNAFGMGIDKPDVRLVVHTAPPDCLENYYQEAGRAGRDGKKAYAVLLYQSADVAEMDKMPDMRYPPMKIIRHVYQSLANYLQLPSGIGEDDSYPFDVQDFIKRFNLPLFQVIYSLQAMQQASILTFQEQIFLPATIQFLSGKEELEAYEEMNPTSEPLIKTLLRTYGGIFDNPVAISEKQIAWLLKEDIGRLKDSLTTLHQNRVILYDPKKETPQIRFLQNRVKAEDLYIDAVAYLKRKNAFTDRIKAMKGYIQVDVCRAQYIGRYFGDEQIVSCGICDLCLAQKRTELSTAEYKLIATALENILSVKNRTAKELTALVTGIDKEKIRKVLEDWGAEERIKLNADGTIALKQKKGPG